MDLTILEALEVTTQETKEYVDEQIVETKEYVDEQPVISYSENQFLDAASRMTAKNNVGVFVGSDEPADALDGDIWIDTDKNVGSGGGSGTNIQLDDTLTVAGMAADAKAVGDALSRKVSTINSIKPDENGNVTISVSSGGGDSLPFVTEEDNGAVLGVSDGEWNKVDLPIVVSDDGYTSIEGLRNATSIDMVRSGNTIVMTTVYDGNVAAESVITLDENDYPIAIITDGVECTISWEGF